MKTSSFQLESANLLAIKRAALAAGLSPAVFLNRFLKDFLVEQWKNDPQGIRKEYLAELSKERKTKAD